VWSARAAESKGRKIGGKINILNTGILIFGAQQILSYRVK